MIYLVPILQWLVALRPRVSKSSFGTGPSTSIGQGSAHSLGLPGVAAHSVKGALPRLEPVLVLPYVSIEDPHGIRFLLPIDRIPPERFFIIHSLTRTRGPK